ncbi:hypothetical protein HYV86_00385 [Candidatus Woesearchaeota archaeon]|nr:hypothetical protein [Candidatus Woesearchaeota archaeon]
MTYHSIDDAASQSPWQIAQDIMLTCIPGVGQYRILNGRSRMYGENLDHGMVSATLLQTAVVVMPLVALVDYLQR